MKILKNITFSIEDEKNVEIDGIFIKELAFKDFYEDERAKTSKETYIGAEAFYIVIDAKAICEIEQLFWFEKLHKTVLIEINYMDEPKQLFYCRDMIKSNKYVTMLNFRQNGDLQINITNMENSACFIDSTGIDIIDTKVFKEHKKISIILSEIRKHLDTKKAFQSKMYAIATLADWMYKRETNKSLNIAEHSLLIYDKGIINEVYNERLRHIKYNEYKRLSFDNLDKFDEDSEKIKEITNIAIDLYKDWSLEDIIKQILEMEKNLGFSIGCAKKKYNSKYY